MNDAARHFDGVPHDLIEAVRRLSRTSRLTVALDFDGVLAPIVDTPGQAKSTPENAQAVVDLTGLSATTVALVSGRSLDSLREVSGAPDGALLVGSHGAEYDLGEGHVGVALTAEEERTLGELRHIVDELAGRHEGVRVETKPAGFALHIRGMESDEGRRALNDASRAVSAAAPGVTQRPGKEVLEFSVVAATKGDAMQRLRLHTSATAMLYAGDDVTDEDAFGALELGDVSVKVGTGATVALYRLSGPEDVGQMLRTLAGARRNHLLGA